MLVHFVFCQFLTVSFSRLRHQRHKEQNQNQMNTSPWASFTPLLNKVSERASFNALFLLIDIIGLEYLSARDKHLFHHETAAYQFAPGLGYQPQIRDAGGSVIVNNLDSAKLAISIIVDQGEGNPGPYDDPDKLERDHYDVFRDLQAGSQSWDVYPVRNNPTTFGYWEEDRRIYQVNAIAKFSVSC